jgi:hypothetical protein
VSILSWGQLWGVWDSVGGARDKGAMMASIAIAESSGNTGVTSPAGAIGAWQIMPFWAGTFGWPVSALFNVTWNARAAVRISGNGTNVGAWDTCYNPPSSAANRRNLSGPLPGSPAWNVWKGQGGHPTGGGGTPTATSSGPSQSERAVLSRVPWANHLQENAIPNNTRWVAYNRTLHRRGPTVL